MEREAILQLKQSGATYQQIAEMIGRTRTRAMQLINGIGEDIFGQCKNCGQERQLHRHHESYWPEVVVLLCQSCHGDRHHERMEKHRLVLASIPKTTSLTREALGRKLGITPDYAAAIARQNGFRYLCLPSVPWPSVNWNIPNKWLARIWGRLDHVVSSARTEQNALKATFDWRDPMVGEFRKALRSEIAKRRQWLKTGEVSG